MIYGMREKYIYNVLEKRKVLANLTQYEIPEITNKLEQFESSHEKQEIMKFIKGHLKKDKGVEINIQKHILDELH